MTRRICAAAPPGSSLPLVGPRQDIQTVKVGGPAITVMRGKLAL